MSERPEDKLTEAEFEAWLEGDSELSTAYKRTGQLEPSSKLDSAVLSAARDELTRASGAGSKPGFWQSWVRPISTVAVMGLCLAVILQVQKTTELVPPEQSDMYAMAPVESFSKEDSAMAQDGDMLNPPSAALAPAIAGNMYRDEMASAPMRSNADSQLAREKRASKTEAKSAEEVVLAARRESDRLQQVAPMSKTSDYADAEMASASDDLYRELELTDGAIAAWNNGARPAADVWWAGIKAAQGTMDQPTLELEARILLHTWKKTIDPNVLKEITEFLPAIAEPDPDRTTKSQTNADSSNAAIASEWAWRLGIEFLDQHGDDQRADAEVAKLMQIYKRND